MSACCDGSLGDSCPCGCHGFEREDTELAAMIEDQIRDRMMIPDWFERLDAFTLPADFQKPALHPLLDRKAMYAAEAMARREEAPPVEPDAVTYRPGVEVVELRSVEGQRIIGRVIQEGLIEGLLAGGRVTLAGPREGARLATWPRSPDCRDVNCHKCPGEAWDLERDQPVACRCDCHPGG